MSMSPMVGSAPAAGAPTRSFERIAELDGIRGIAILLVMCAHFGYLESPNGLIREALGLGWAGVDLFFVLSGFLITGILMDSKGSPDYFRRFYLRRVFRIFPIYYAFLFLYFHVLPWIAHTGTDHTSETWYWLYVSNWRFDPNRYLAHFWSLSIEEQFYLAWPLVVSVTSRRVMMYVCMTLVILSPALRMLFQYLGTAPMVLYQSTPFRLDGLAAGALVAIAMRDGVFRMRLRRLVPVACLLAALLLSIAIARTGTSPFGSAMEAFGYTGVVLAGSLLVFRGMETQGGPTLTARWLRTPWLVRFGKYSYGIYVWHLPIAVQMLRLTELLRRHAGAPLGWVLLGMSLIGGVALAYGVALLSWALIETPFQRLRQRIAGYEPSGLGSRTEISSNR